MAYDKALKKEKLRKWGRLCRKGEKIKFVDVTFCLLVFLAVQGSSSFRLILVLFSIKR